MTTINAYCTRRELPALAFAHQLVESRDRTDPELLPHLHGCDGAFAARIRRP